MKRIMFIIAFLVVFVATLYIIFNYPLWYFSGVVIVAIVMHLTEKPMLLEPDDPRFDY